MTHPTAEEYIAEARRVYHSNDQDKRYDFYLRHDEWPEDVLFEADIDHMNDEDYDYYTA